MQFNIFFTIPLSVLFNITNQEHLLNASDKKKVEPYQPNPDLCAIRIVQYNTKTVILDYEFKNRNEVGKKI